MTSRTSALTTKRSKAADWDQRLQEHQLLLPREARITISQHGISWSGMQIHDAYNTQLELYIGYILSKLSEVE